MAVTLLIWQSSTASAVCRLTKHQHKLQAPKRLKNNTCKGRVGQQGIQTITNTPHWTLSTKKHFLCNYCTSWGAILARWPTCQFRTGRALPSHSSVGTSGPLWGSLAQQAPSETLEHSVAQSSRQDRWSCQVADCITSDPVTLRKTIKFDDRTTLIWLVVPFKAIGLRNLALPVVYLKP